MIFVPEGWVEEGKYAAYTTINYMSNKWRYHSSLTYFSYEGKNNNKNKTKKNTTTENHCHALWHLFRCRKHGQRKDSSSLDPTNTYVLFRPSHSTPPSPDHCDWLTAWLSKQSSQGTKLRHLFTALHTHTHTHTLHCWALWSRPIWQVYLEI